jgi:hypothetical protein
LNIRLELSKRVLSLKMLLPKEPILPESRKENSGNDMVKDMREAQNEQGEMDEQNA